MTEPALIHPVASDVETYLAECRRLVLDEIRAIVPRRRRFSGVLYDLMLDYPLRPAKALRPAISIATCRALGGHLEAVLPSAAVLELYHNAFLIHDDVEDGSERRRDGRTLHRLHGVPIAINVGDGMLALALTPLLDNMHLLGMGKALRILQAVRHMAQESVEGQAVELDWVRRGRWSVSDRDYLDMVDKKTGWYSFATPMIIGAIVAGAPSERIDALTRFAMRIGSAFQIQDDVLNLEAGAHAYGKEIGGDLWEGKRTLILLHAMRATTSGNRRRAMAILARPRPTGGRRRGSTIRYKSASDVAFLLRLIERHGSVAYARNVARARAGAAARELARMSWLPPSVHRDFLQSLVDFVIARDH